MVTRPSEVAVLVDTSQSMSLPPELGAGSPSRSARAAQLLESTDLISKLAAEHRISIYAFGDQAEPRLIETRGGELTGATDSAARTRTPSNEERSPSWAVCWSPIGLLLGFVSLIIGAAGRSGSVGWWVVGCAWHAGRRNHLAWAASTAVRSDQTLSQILGIGSQPDDESVDQAEDESELPPTMRVIDWSQEIAAAGAQSRIGDAHSKCPVGPRSRDPRRRRSCSLMAKAMGEPRPASRWRRRGVVRWRFIRWDWAAATRRSTFASSIWTHRAACTRATSLRSRPSCKRSGPRPIEVEVQLLDGLDNPNPSDPKPPTPQIVPPGDVIESQTRAGQE